MLREVSAAVMPLLIFVILGYGLFRRVDLFDAFLSGAKSGLSASFGVLPALVGLMAAISMLRASGALECIINAIAPLTGAVGIPKELLPLAILRPISGSGALAVVQDIISQNGPDSFVGRIASVVMGSTETTFYTLAVYFGSVGIKNSRFALPAALSADLTGLICGVLLCRVFFT